MCTISLRSRSRNEIFISNFKGFVLLLPTQTFFYFMPIQLNFVCQIDNDAHLYFYKADDNLSIVIYEKRKDEEEEEFCSVVLSKQEVKRLIKELSLSLKNLD